MYVVPKSDIKGCNSVKYTITSGDKTAAVSSQYYCTAMISNGINYVPASEDSVMLIVTVSSKDDLSEAKCTYELSKDSVEGGN